jgi:peptidoglycan/xylan/chitin deacetylase (PgdA/CDA1 family)
MLLILLYHQLVEAHFRGHLEYIVDRYPVVLPGELLQSRLSVCLTFDDAYSDIYTLALPLLREFGLRGLLAVPTARVGCEGYCNWEQLAEIAASGHFQIASHSHTHCNMAEPFEAKMEIEESRHILESRLGVAVNSFVYPYGKVTAQAHQQVMQRYRYAMRIGTAYNHSWECQEQPLHRVVADGTHPFGWRKRLIYWSKLQIRSKRTGRAAPSGQPSAGG